MDFMQNALRDLVPNYGHGYGLLYPIFSCIGFLFVIIKLLHLFLKPTSFPLINKRKPLEFTNRRIMREFLTHSQKLVQQGLKEHSIFQLITHIGPMTILGPEYISEIQNNKQLSFMPILIRELFAKFPGFDLFREGTDGTTILQDAVRLGSTYHISKSTQFMSDEIDKFLADTWGDEQEWHQITAKTSCRNIIGRLSALIFYGQELCDNEDWLEVTDEYAYTGFMAARELRLWPQILRPLIQWFLPCCRRLRVLARKTRSLVQPVLTARREEKARYGVQGKGMPEYHDAIEFMERAAKGRPYDAAMGPVLFSVNALHTTTDLLTQALLDLSEQPDLIDALRQEIMTVMPHRAGWKRSAVDNLRLLDSVIKESLRLKPSESILMRRYAMEDVTLADGSLIQKGTILGISTFQMRDPEIYTEPDTYNGYRFLEMQKVPELERKCPLVATSPAHLGFGHGIHACPGRFLAAIQIKIILCHIIMKYDFRQAGAVKAKVQVHGIDLISDPEAEIVVRKREQNLLFV